MDREFAAALLDQMGKKIPDVLINFGRALDDAGVLEDGWHYFLSKPWKWASEYAAWRDLDGPMEGDERWPQFLDEISAA